MCRTQGRLPEAPRLAHTRGGLSGGSRTCVLLYASVANLCSLTKRAQVRNVAPSTASSLEEAIMSGNITITVANTFPSVSSWNEAILKQICVSQVTKPLAVALGAFETHELTHL
jgi:hypothetical protein